MKGLLLQRKIFTDKSTIGDLFLEGEFLCRTLEDTVRRQKVYGETAIPSGTYEVVIRESSRFKQRLPALLKVPYFEGILIHNGNTKDHTNGCILTGQYDPKVQDFVGRSVATLSEVFPKIEQALAKDRLWIQVIGGFSYADFEMAKKLNQA